MGAVFYSRRPRTSGNCRKDYRELSLLRMRYPKVPIMALTATATVPVKYDIV